MRTPELITRFYVLPDEADLDQRLAFACRLVERSAQEGLSAFVLCADQDMLDTLDERLWRFKQESFLPHCRLDDELARHAKIWLAAPPERANRADVLINLSLEPQPDIPRDCQRIFELVSAHQEVLSATRARFAAYRARGITPQTHRL
ncbi:DNA polymerase III subunit chi [Suttonella sp. R2A3]|uniref:DNA polymerase III subunit chi n=1 Tax=Suttonella sp. R2A3 TaxID=2908648 RepID=UPI001F4322B3|nr:DNA polymerase III subunit chi [Suttonella sp. R2A3]UJF23853.1 DNA polymerase III subunit chi [Suttonella sp. R2A3]